jgi:hypothetical protein
MASLVLSGDTSGSITLAAPAVAGSTTQTLVNVTGTLAPIVLGTAQASTSGTSIDFTGIPSWVERITVMFNGVSTNGTSNPIVQIGAGSFTTTGYASGSIESGNTRAAYTGGFGILSGNASNLIYGQMVLTNISTTAWVSTLNSVFDQGGVYYSVTGAGSISLGGTLDRVRITTVNGAPVFDAGTINILYE